MLCLVQQTAYMCSNASGTSCTKLAVTVLKKTNSNPCTTAEYTALTSQELDQYLQSPFRLNLDEAAPIVGAVLGLWAIGYGFRMVIRALRVDEYPVIGSD